MHHRVDACGRRDGAGQADRELGIQDGQVGIELRRDHAHLGRLACGDDGHRRHLGARARGGRHLDQRQACAGDLADAVHLFQRLLRGQQRGDQLGHVHGRATAQAQHHLRLGTARTLGGLQHDVLGRVGHHVVDHGDLPAVLGQAGQRRIEQAALVQEAVGDQAQAGLGVALTQDGADAACRTELHHQRGNRLELEGVHGVPFNSTSDHGRCGRPGRARRLHAAGLPPTG